MNECKDCKLNEGDCGHHFSMNSIIDYTIPSQTACDRYDCCMFFKPKKYETMTNKEAVKWLNKNRPCISMTCNKENADNINIATDMAIEALENKRLQGEWIKGPEISRTMIGDIQHIDYKYYTCSNCGLFLDYLLYHVDGSPFYKFCPECGAEMRGGEND